MSKIQAILFDFDGTLRDTESIVYDSLAHALKTHGVEMPTKEELAPYLHHHNFVHEKFAGHISLEDFDKHYYEFKGKALLEVALFEDVHDGLIELKKDFKLGLVTAARTKDLDLDRLGLSEMFDVVIGGDQLAKHKPHPEGIKQALKMLNVEPDQAVYVGDMPTDIEAGKAANLAAVIGVNYGFMTPEQLFTAGADYMVGSVGELAAIVDRIK